MFMVHYITGKNCKCNIYNKHIIKGIMWYDLIQTGQNRSIWTWPVGDMADMRNWSILHNNRHLTRYCNSSNAIARRTITAATSVRTALVTTSRDGSRKLVSGAPTGRR